MKKITSVGSVLLAIVFAIFIVPLMIFGAEENKVVTDDLVIQTPIVVPPGDSLNVNFVLANPIPYNILPEDTANPPEYYFDVNSEASIYFDASNSSDESTIYVQSQIPLIGSEDNNIGDLTFIEGVYDGIITNLDTKEINSLTRFSTWDSGSAYYSFYAEKVKNLYLYGSIQNVIYEVGSVDNFDVLIDTLDTCSSISNQIEGKPLKVLYWPPVPEEDREFLSTSIEIEDIGFMEVSTVQDETSVFVASNMAENSKTVNFSSYVNDRPYANSAKVSELADSGEITLRRQPVGGIQLFDKGIDWELDTVSVTPLFRGSIDVEESFDSISSSSETEQNDLTYDGMPIEFRLISGGVHAASWEIIIPLKVGSNIIEFDIDDCTYILTIVREGIVLTDPPTPPTETTTETPTETPTTRRKSSNNKNIQKIDIGEGNKSAGYVDIKNDKVVANPDKKEFLDRLNDPDSKTPNTFIIENQKNMKKFDFIFHPSWLDNVTGAITIESDGIGSITFSQEQLMGGANISVDKITGYITITLEYGSLNAKLLQNGKDVNWYNYVSPILISMPYKASASNSDYVIMRQISDSSGKSAGNKAIARSWHKNDTAYAWVYSMGKFDASVSKPTSFKDTKGAWMEAAVSKMVARKIINGISETEFDPDSNITRADYVALLMRALNGYAETDPSNDFSDVKSSDYFYTEVTTAKALGIIKGSTFNPKVKITREDMFTITYQAMKVFNMIPKSIPNVKVAYKDENKISANAKDAITVLTKLGLIAGYQGEVNPQGQSTRGEAAQFLSSVLFIDRK